MTPQPHFLALLTYLTTEQGGRKTPAATGYRPQIQFPFHSGQFPGSQNFIDTENAFPGETLNAEITLPETDYFKGRIYAGLDFEFYENGVLIGTGVIKKLLHPDLKAIA